MQTMLVNFLKITLLASCQITTSRFAFQLSLTKSLSCFTIAFNATFSWRQVFMGMCKILPKIHTKKNWNVWVCDGGRIWHFQENSRKNQVNRVALMRYLMFSLLKGFQRLKLCLWRWQSVKLFADTAQSEWE